jgi:hypothetical protein
MPRQDLLMQAQTKYVMTPFFAAAARGHTGISGFRMVAVGYDEFLTRTETICGGNSPVARRVQLNTELARYKSRRNAAELSSPLLAIDYAPQRRRIDDRWHA